MSADGSLGGQHRERGRWSRITAAWSRLLARLPLGLALSAVTAVWAFGAVWSFTEQSAFARAKGFSDPALLPLVLDGLAVAMAGVAFAASLDARPAVGARLGTALAVLASASSNGLWAAERSSAAGAGANPALHSPDWTTVAIGAGIPIAANIAFEVLLGELRRQVQRRRGLPAPVALPSLRLLRLVLAPRSTFREWRDEVLARTAPAGTSAPRSAPLVRLSVRRLDGPATETAPAHPRLARAQPLILEQGSPVPGDGDDSRGSEDSEAPAAAAPVEPSSPAAELDLPASTTADIAISPAPELETDSGGGVPLEHPSVVDSLDEAEPAPTSPRVAEPGPQPEQDAEDARAAGDAGPPPDPDPSAKPRTSPEPDLSPEPGEPGDQRVRLLVGLLADRPAMKGPDAAEALAEAGMQTSYRTARRLLGEARDVAASPGSDGDGEADRDDRTARTGTDDSAHHDTGTGPAPLSLVPRPLSTPTAEGGEPR